MVIIVLSGCLSVAIAQTPAQENAPLVAPGIDADFSTLKRTGGARVDKVIDATTIMMKDNKVVRLAGIESPGGGESDAALPAYEYLQRLLPENTGVVLYQTRSDKLGRTNRMGQTLAHLQIEQDGTWVQGALLREGLVRAMPDDANPELGGPMYALEDAARKSNKGIWADPLYALRTPASVKVGGLEVVEGKVLNAATVRNNLYLNFGDDWKTDFTVRIDTDVRRQMAKAGIDPLSLSGKTLRVRGYVEEYNGPMISLESIHQLEILDR